MRIEIIQMLTVPIKDHLRANENVSPDQNREQNRENNKRNDNNRDNVIKDGDRE